MTNAAKQVEHGLRLMASEFRVNAEKSKQKAFADRAILCDGAAAELEMLRGLVRDMEPRLVPFEFKNGDGKLISQALKSFRYDTSGDEATGLFLAEQFEKLSTPKTDA